MNSWYLRKPDGKEFGPESIKTLVKWAEQSRIIAGNEVSEDKKNWQLVENVAELDICYIAILSDKSIYGPFNIRATHDLIKHNVFTKDATIVNKRNGEEIVADDFLKQKRKKTNPAKTISGQSDFELLSSPESELQSNLDKSEDKKSNKPKITSKTENKKLLRDKMDSKKQEFLFNDEDDLQYVVDEDAQIEMPFEEEPTVVYNGENFPAPTQNNTVFVSKDTERFPELLTKKTILSIDDVQPAEDQKQTKLFEENTKEDDADNYQDSKNKSIPEEVDDKDAEVKEKKLTNDVKTETTHDSPENDTQLADLKQSLETTTKLFVEQQTKDREKIKALTAERNKLEQEVANDSDSIKNIKELNQTLELSLKETKQQLKQLFDQVNEKDDIIKNLKNENSKFQNGMDVNKEEINELVESKKDLTLALAAERDKLKKQEKITLEYQNKLEDDEEKHNKIIEDYTEKTAELLEEKQHLENTKETLINNHKTLEEKIKDMETGHIQTTKNLEEKLIAIRQELKAEEELKENFKKEVKELQSKIKSADTIVNERMRSINEQTTRISTKYKQECRLTERLTSTNKKLITTIAVLILILIILLGAILYVFTLKSGSKQLESTNIQKENISPPVVIVKDDITPSTPLISENISLVGAKTFKEDELVKVVFDEAMFSKLSSLSAFAIKNTRANLAEYKKYLRNYDMIIEGHTDESPMTGNSKYKDNKELGLARAESFKNLLVVSFGIPAENISTVSAGSHNPPFSNSTPEGREKNKTVVLYFKNK
jgi:chemotaxis protein MotB